MVQDVHELHVIMIKKTIDMLQIFIITQLVFQDMHESHVKMIKKLYTCDKYLSSHNLCF